MRKIIHIDMDAFYASVEQRDNPQLRGKPVAVGYSGERGVVAAAGYEARKYGIHSAMPSKTALKKCPHLIFIPARFDVYREISLQIRNIFSEYTDLVEPLSLDEAYLDVTINHKNMPSATLIAKEIKQRIKQETGLTASAGVSINKFLAKIASDYQKPDGLFVITEKEAEAFVENLKIEQFRGVGKVTAEKMYQLGIYTGTDLKKMSEEELLKHFGKAGHTYYLNARAQDYSEVVSDRIRKSIGAENTFLSDLNDLHELKDQLHEIAETVWERIEKRNFYGRTVTLKIKYDDFTRITRSKTHLKVIQHFETFWDTAAELLNQVDLSEKKVRLAGLSISNTQETEPPRYYQLKLDFEEFR
jgi:Nucleotidyltransferase/DNA polymerase involved in DNA repair